MRLDPDDVAAAVRDNTAMILTETPANPTLKCADIAAISESRAKPVQCTWSTTPC